MLISYCKTTTEFSGIPDFSRCKYGKWIKCSFIESHCPPDGADTLINSILSTQFHLAAFTISI